MRSAKLELSSRRVRLSFKSNPLFLSLACVSLLLTASLSNAQTLEDVCFGGVELTEYVASIVGAGEVVNADFYTASEQAEIATVLAGAAQTSASAAEQVRSVLQACTDGQILQARTSAALNQ